jgi:hypothetical protein
MQPPPYWLPRPPFEIDRPTADAFDQLLDRTAYGALIDYRLAAPKWQFLCYVADRADVVLHGSGDPDIERFEPRQPEDPLEFSNRLAVFAATDGIWPMYYAILDRATYPMLLCNACIRIDSGDPYYFFSITDAALQYRPWRTGTVYLLPAGGFERQPPIEAEGSRIHIAQAASPDPVAPIARLTVDAADFPFLASIRGHDDAVLSARMAADPAGFPWVEGN